MLYLLDKNTKTARWNGEPLHEATSAVVKEVSNGDFVLEVKYPITNSGIYQEIKEDMLIKAPTPDLGDQLFRIKKPVEHDNHIEITAYHISYDIMQRSIKPISVYQVSCATALSQMVQQAKTDLVDFSFASDIVKNRTFNTTEDETLYSVLMDGKHSIVGTWEGELIRDNFSLSIKQNRGEDRGVIITTHKNLKSYQRSKNSQQVVTRIYATSTFKPEGAKEDTVLKVTVDSPLIHSYPYINEKEYENNSAKTVEELRTWAESKFTHEHIDKVSDAIEIEAYELDGQIVHLGDMVTIKSWKHAVDLRKKAVAYAFDTLTEKYISLTFDDKADVGGAGVSSGVSALADEVLGNIQTANDIALQRAIDNANRAFDAEFDKTREAIEDGIEEAKAAAEVVKAEIAAKVAEVEAEAGQLAQQAQDADRKADEALERVRASQDLAQSAKDVADGAKAFAEETKRNLIVQADQLQQSLTATQQSVREQSDAVADQARAQLDLQILVTETKKTADGTKTTVTELTKTVNATTGNLTSVTQRVASFETGLSGVREQYSQLNQTLSDKDGQITAIQRQTAELQRGLDGTKASLNAVWVGGPNLLADTEKMSDQDPKRNQNGSLATMFGRAVKHITVPANSAVEVVGYRKALTTALYGHKEIIVSFYAKAQARGQTIKCRLLDNRNIVKIVETSTGHTNEATDGLIEFPVTNGWLRYWIKYTFKQPCYDAPTVIIGSLGGDLSSTARWVEVNSPAVYHFHFNKEWSPSDIDIKTEFATYQQTLTRNLAELEGQIKATNGSLSDLKTSYDQTKESINLLASKTEVNAVTGRLSSAESSIQLHADQIAQRLTRTEAERLIDGKNLVSSTVFDNYKRETAQSIERQLTATRELIPGAVSSVNLVPNSKINESSNAYGFANRQVNLTAGKTYWFGARAKRTGGTGKETRVWLIAPGWAESRSLTFTSTDYETKFLKYVPGTSGTFDIRSYWFPTGGDRTGTADVDWYMVAESDVQPTNWAPAPEDLVSTVDFNRVKETAQLYERVLGKTEGDVTANMSRQVMTSDLFLTEIKNPLADATTQVQHLSDNWAVKYLTDRGDVLSQLNLNSGGVKIQGKLIHLNGQTLIDNGVIKSAMIADLDAGKITTGTLDAKHIGANAITATHLKVDAALFDKLVATEALIRKLTAQSAFVTSVQAVDLSATQIKGGVLRSLNGQLEFDLQKSVLNTYSNTSAIRRVSDQQSQFIKMISANGATHTVIGANRKANDEGIGTADFTGIRISSRAVAKGGLQDQIDIFVDSLYITGGGNQGDGLHFKNNQHLRPQTTGRLYLGTNDKRWREVHANDYYINGQVLSTYLKSIRACLTQFANGGAQQSTYDYIKNQISSVLGKLP